MADSGMVVLDALIAKLRKLAGPTIGARVAAKAAPLVEAELKRTAAAGKTPEGRTWQQKKDGGRPLVHAADAIETTAAGNYVVTTLTGPTVWHQLGAGGKPVRAVIPDSGKIPPAVEKVVIEAATEVFREIVGGR